MLSPMEKMKLMREMWERLKVKFEGLDMADELPSLPAFYLMHEHFVEFWQEIRDKQEGEHRSGLVNIYEGDDRIPPEEVEIELQPHKGDDPNALDLTAVHQSDSFVIGVLDTNENCLFMLGHRMVIERGGRAASYHEDGSECVVGCFSCEEANVYVTRIEGSHYYAHCKGCGSHTAIYDDCYLALGAWTIGKFSQKRESESIPLF